MKLRKLLCVVSVLAMCSATVPAMAQQGSSVGYAVRAVLPDNQRDTGATYFDLKVEPGQVQTLQVVIKNRESEAIEVAVEANTAFSNANGVIEFTQTQARDESMLVDFAEIAQPVESVITVPAASEVVAEFVLTMPDEPFEGVVYGGFMFTMLNQERVSDVGSVSIQNIYRYVIGVRMQQSDAPVEPQFELAGAASNALSTQSLLLTLRNPKPLIAQGITVRVRVFAPDEGAPIFEYEKGNVSMAPNTSMPFTVYLGNEQTLVSGAYRLTVDMQYEGQTWAFETPLNVDNE